MTRLPYMAAALVILAILIRSTIPGPLPFFSKPEPEKRVLNYMKVRVQLYSEPSQDDVILTVPFSGHSEVFCVPVPSGEVIPCRIYSVLAE